MRRLYARSAALKSSIAALCSSKETRCICFNLETAASQRLQYLADGWAFHPTRVGDDARPQVGWLCPLGMRLRLNLNRPSDTRTQHGERAHCGHIDGNGHTLTDVHHKRPQRFGQHVLG